MKYTMSPQIKMLLHEEVSRILYDQKQLYTNDQLEEIMRSITGWFRRTLPDAIDVAQQQWAWENLHNHKKGKKRGGKFA